MSLFSLLSLLLSLGVNSLRQTYTTLLLRRRLHYIRTSVYVVFSGTSTIYFIRPKHCALLVQSNTRENSFLFFVLFFCSFFLFPFLPLYLCESARIRAYPRGSPDRARSTGPTFDNQCSEGRDQRHRDCLEFCSRICWFVDHGNVPQSTSTFNIYYVRDDVTIYADTLSTALCYNCASCEILHDYVKLYNVSFTNDISFYGFVLKNINYKTSKLVSCSPPNCILQIYSRKILFALDFVACSMSQKFTNTVRSIVD